MDDVNDRCKKLGPEAESEIWALLGRDPEADMRRWDSKFGYSTEQKVKKRKVEEANFLAACARLKNELEIELANEALPVDCDQAKDTRCTEKAVWSLLYPEIQKQVRREGIHEFFPIQRAILPTTLSGAQYRFSDDGLAMRDICVAAPTGSGKTLVYALTLLQFLCRRRIKRLRAIVVAPSRELARQIYGEFLRFIPPEMIEALDLRCEHSGGLQLNNAVFSSNESKSTTIENEATPDILIATPGRLTQRVRDSSLNLEHLEYLIADEADRLTEQYYHGWARKLLARRHAAVTEKDSAIQRFETYWKAQDWHDPTRIGYHEAMPALPTRLRLRKLLFSATLGDDPRLLSTLRLARPLFFYVDSRSAREDQQEQHQTEMNSLVRVTSSPLEAARGKYVLSDSLASEEALLCDAATKPLCLLSSLDSFFSTQSNDPVTKSAMLFCNSIDTALRLAALLKLIYEDDTANTMSYTVLELSAAASAARRDAVFTHFRNSASHAIIVASDAGSRGIDLPSLGLVINYDLPSDTRTYVHRLGRTARAQQPGAALTLVKKGQEAVFARMRANIDSKLPQPVPLPRSKLRPLAQIYKKALANLKPKLDDIRTGASARMKSEARINQGQHDGLIESRSGVVVDFDDDFMTGDDDNDDDSGLDEASSEMNKEDNSSMGLDAG